ncbi:MAG: DUF2256 domain-containing protein [Burkholderiaceae bacterium]
MSDLTRCPRPLNLRYRIVQRLLCTFKYVLSQGLLKCACKKIGPPSELCQRRNLLFTWRKKWKKVWCDVKYCSDRCRQDSRCKA